MELFDINVVAFVAVSLFITIAVILDLKTRRIPNWLTVSAFVAGLAFHTFTAGFGGLLFSLGGFAVGFGTLLVLWLIGGGGGGDVKMMGAVGAWVGAVPTLLIFLGSALFAVVCMIAVIVWQNVAPRPAAMSTGSPGDSVQTQKSVLKQSIPYAMPVALATWTLLLMQLIKNAA